MSRKYYIGVDNGVSGAIGIVSDEPGFNARLIQTPVFTQQNYTKKKGNITRINIVELESLLEPYKEDSFILIERPLVNPGRFRATISAVRALEATLIIIEKLGIPFEYADSKKWQTALLGTGFKGPELKVASFNISNRLFPHLKKVIAKQKDGDAILMAEYARRQNL